MGSSPSHRDAEDLPARRGLDVPCQSFQRWVRRFDVLFARELCCRRPTAAFIEAATREWIGRRIGAVQHRPPRSAVPSAMIRTSMRFRRRAAPGEDEVPGELRSHLESLRESEATRLQHLLALKRMNASLQYDDGRRLEDLIKDAKTAIRNLDLSIANLSKRL